jgi:hypothetical protein
MFEIHATDEFWSVDEERLQEFPHLHGRIEAGAPSVRLL